MKDVSQKQHRRKTSESVIGRFGPPVWFAPLWSNSCAPCSVQHPFVSLCGLWMMSSLNQMRDRWMHQVTFTVPIRDPLPPNYFIKVLADR